MNYCHVYRIHPGRPDHQHQRIGRKLNLGDALEIARERSACELGSCTIVRDGVTIGRTDATWSPFAPELVRVAERLYIVPESVQVVEWSYTHPFWSDAPILSESSEFRST